jgi:hypothetical protein
MKRKASGETSNLINNHQIDNADAAAAAGCFSLTGMFAATNNHHSTPSVSSPPIIDTTDAILGNEMNQLSLQERNLALEEIHGVANVVEETPDFVELRLERLESEISKLKKKSAYERTKFMCPRYVYSTKLRLKFLRAERFDATKAAKRMITFFELKLQLFGMDKLVRDITWDDLSTQDRAIMTSGGISILPWKDRSGRQVACRVPIKITGCGGNMEDKQLDHLTYVRLGLLHHLLLCLSIYLPLSNTPSFFLPPCFLVLILYIYCI